MGFDSGISFVNEGRATDLKKDVSTHLLLEPHICRHCFGRIGSTVLATPGGTGQAWLYTCTNCGATEKGPDASVLCCCGIKLKSDSLSGKQTDAGIRCHPNPNPTLEFPALFVASSKAGK